MTRVTTGSEAKKRLANGTPSSQRLTAAGARAFEAHARVRRLAERLIDELDHVTSPHGVPVTDLDPEDSMVVAVENVISSTKATIPPPMATSELSPPRTSTKLGIAPIPKTAKSR